MRRVQRTSSHLCTVCQSPRAAPCGSAGFSGLSEAEILTYERDGFVVPKHFTLSQSTLESVKAQHQQLLDAQPDHPEFADYCPSLAAVRARLRGVRPRPSHPADGGAGGGP